MGIPDIGSTTSPPKKKHWDGLDPSKIPSRWCFRKHIRNIPETFVECLKQMIFGVLKLTILPVYDLNYVKSTLYIHPLLKKSGLNLGCLFNFSFSLYLHAPRKTTNNSNRVFVRVTFFGVRRDDRRDILASVLGRIIPGTSNRQEICSALNSAKSAAEAVQLLRRHRGARWCFENPW